MNDDHLHLVLQLHPSIDAVAFDAFLDEAVESTLEDLNEPPDLEDLLLQGVVSRWFSPSQSGEDAICRIVLDIHEVSADLEERRTFVLGLMSRFTADTSRVTTCVRFRDDRILEANAKLARELFHIEMQLREVLTLLILFSRQGSVAEVMEHGQASPKNPPSAQELRHPHGENELFYVLFGEYATVNNVSRQPSLNSIVSALANHSDFDNFKQHVLRSIVIEDDLLEGFLASIKTLMDPIEKVRNAVAHNRIVRQSSLDNYIAAKEQLTVKLAEALNDFSSGAG